MKIFAGPRSSGRTTALIDWVREERQFRALVVIDACRADRIRLQARDIRIWVGAAPLPHRVDLALDDAEGFLGRPFEYWRQVKAISLESEDYLNIPRPDPGPDNHTAILGLRRLVREFR